MRRTLKTKVELDCTLFTMKVTSFTGSFWIIWNMCDWYAILHRQTNTNWQLTMMLRPWLMTKDSSACFMSSIGSSLITKVVSFCDFFSMVTVLEILTCWRTFFPLRRLAFFRSIAASHLRRPEPKVFWYKPKKRFISFGFYDKIIRNNFPKITQNF